MAPRWPRAPPSAATASHPARLLLTPLEARQEQNRAHSSDGDRRRSFGVCGALGPPGDVRGGQPHLAAWGETCWGRTFPRNAMRLQAASCSPRLFS